MQIPEVVGQSVFDELFCISPITRSNSDLVRKPQQYLAVYMSIFHCLWLANMIKEDLMCAL